MGYHYTFPFYPTYFVMLHGFDIFLKNLMMPGLVYSTIFVAAAHLFISKKGHLSKKNSGITLLAGGWNCLLQKRPFRDKSLERERKVLLS